MTAGCKRIRADALAAEATAVFHKYRIDELPVVDADDRPVGLIDVQDIVTIKVVGMRRIWNDGTMECRDASYSLSFHHSTIPLFHFSSPFRR